MVLVISKQLKIIRIVTPKSNFNATFSRNFFKKLKKIAKSCRNSVVQCKNSKIFFFFKNILNSNLFIQNPVKLNLLCCNNKAT